MSTWQSRLGKHGQWQKISDNLWHLSGSLPRGQMPRNMVVFRRANGRLVIHSAVVVDESCLSEMLSWGQPEFLVVPNPWHRLDASAYAEKFPKIKVVAPAAALEKVREKVRVDGACEDLLPGSGFEPLAIPGLKEIELCYQVDLPEGKGLIFTDALMNLPHLQGFEGKILRWIGSTGFFGMTRIGKFILLKNARDFQQWLSAQSKIPNLSLITVAHGSYILGNKCAQQLRDAAARLDKS